MTSKPAVAVSIFRKIVFLSRSVHFVNPVLKKVDILRIYYASMEENIISFFFGGIK